METKLKPCPHCGGRATVAQVSERAIRNYEDGKQYPSRGTYNRLAEFFGWSLWE